jgi:hypothetical protein
MLCLIDSIRHDAPSVQRVLRAVEDAQTLTALLLAAWSLARVMTVHIVEYVLVLAERACRATVWPRCSACGVSLRSKGFVKRQVTSLLGPIRWQRRVGRCPRGCDSGQVAPFDAELGVQPISGPVVSSNPWAVRWRSLCRLRQWRACWAGIAGARSARARYGVGCKRLGNGPWRGSRGPCKQGP